jgi:16S rRNA (guanine527-N7)-methyltransferase
LPTDADYALINAIWPLDPATRDRFASYRLALERWQVRTNLVASASLEQFWSRHVADSLQCIARFPECCRWIDLGSGAGFPGMVIAIASASAHRDSQHRLVESNAKKCAFLREVARETGANVKVHCERIESFASSYKQDREPLTVITARALAPMARLLPLAEPLLRRGAVGLFHKGREYRRELAECIGLGRFDLLIHQSWVLPDSVLIELRCRTIEGSPSSQHPEGGFSGST